MNAFFLYALLMAPLIAFPKQIDSFLKQHLYETAIVSQTQISLPGYPHAYNPSLIPYQDGYLLSFRYTTRLPEEIRFHRIDASFIGIAKLNHRFQLIPESVQLLKIQSHASRFSLSAEDGRLFLFKDKIYLFFNDRPAIDPKGFAMYFAELIETQGLFQLKTPAKPLYYPSAISIEKNWSPFVAQDKLYLIYSDSPRTILQVDEETGHCQAIAKDYTDPSWPFGEIRGGTPACLVEDFYLTFFHSSFPADTPKKRAYVMGAYLFDPNPPFKVLFRTPWPLGTLSDYTESNDPKVIFPCGLVVRGNSLFVAWGKADRQIQITEFDKKKLFDCMQPCREESPFP